MCKNKIATKKLYEEHTAVQSTHLHLCTVSVYETSITEWNFSFRLISARSSSFCQSVVVRATVVIATTGMTLIIALNDHNEIYSTVNTI